MSSPQENIPYFAEGEVVSGFGRGSKELGIPTANFPEHVIKELPLSFECGVYYGWAKLSSGPQVYKMTMCVGWNPYYHNTVKTMETHIIHQFDTDFYGDIMKIIILGFIRPMCDFPSLDALVKAIHNDIEVSSQHLDTAESLQYKSHPFFQSFQQNKTSEIANVKNGTSVEPNQLAAEERLCDNDSSNAESSSGRIEDSQQNCSAERHSLSTQGSSRDASESPVNGTVPTEKKHSSNKPYVTEVKIHAQKHVPALPNGDVTPAGMDKYSCGGGECTGSI